MHDVTDYTAQMNALLPVGKLWGSLREDPIMQNLLAALATEFARVDVGAERLLNEFDARTTFDLLPEWEAFAGLPDACSGLGTTLQQRRDALFTALTSVGGQSRQYFIDVAARLGFAGATITEFEPHTVDASVDAPIYGQDWRFAWRVTAPMPAIQQMTVDADVDASLGEQAPTTRLECIINRFKPAHTIALFSYT